MIRPAASGSLAATGRDFFNTTFNASAARFGLAFAIFVGVFVGVFVGSAGFDFFKLFLIGALLTPVSTSDSGRFADIAARKLGFGCSFGGSFGVDGPNKPGANILGGCGGPVGPGGGGGARGPVGRGGGGGRGPVGRWGGGPVGPSGGGGGGPVGPSGGGGGGPVGRVGFLDLLLLVLENPTRSGSTRGGGAATTA